MVSGACFVSDVLPGPDSFEEPCFLLSEVVSLLPHGINGRERIALLDARYVFTLNRLSNASRQEWRDVPWSVGRLGSNLLTRHSRYVRISAVTDYLASSPSLMLRQPGSLDGGRSWEIGLHICLILAIALLVP